MSLDFALVLRYLPAIFEALGTTLVMWLAGSLGALALGFCLAVLRRYGPDALGFVLRLYVDVFRGTPFLIQLFLLYYGGPFIGLSLDRVPAGLLAFTAYGAAYFSEIFRAGFEAVPVGHIEAAECAGLGRGQIVRRILIPEMTMLVLPALINMMIILLKETAVFSIISVPELTNVIQAIATEHYAFLESLSLLALFYWGLVELCGLAGRFAEQRLSRFGFAAS